MSVPKTIVWFRQDLRIKDNPALCAACDAGNVLPIFIEDTNTPDQFALGGASKWWLHHSLMQLNDSLGGNLRVYRGDPAVIISVLCEELDCTQVMWNRCYDSYSIARDSALKQTLKQSDIKVNSYNSLLLWEPMQVLKKDGTAYKVFTPYYRKGCLQQAAPRYPLAAPAKITYCDGPSQENASSNKFAVQIDELGYIPEITWYKTMADEWQPGENGAADRLQTFISQAALRYKDDRNLPAVSGTSKLSPYLHFGEISPNQVWYAILDAFNGASDEHIDCYLSELGWREFSYYLLYHFNTITTENFNPKFDHFPWRTDNDALQRWQRGQTGIPIVDAGMRELWHTGYMHNRVRMIVGSFLVKNLLLDWRLGERWFWDTLLDADTASNSASWQWVAGSGADAAPYFRVFNPILQGEKFDKQGEYVQKWCPELGKLPAKYIHQPWAAPDHILRACGVVLGHNYPKPIVDLKTSRQRALDAFAAIKNVVDAPSDAQPSSVSSM